MKSMEEFGRKLAAYEGVADVSLQSNAGKIDLSGYFEAAQFPHGRLTIDVVSTNRPRGAGHISSQDPSLEVFFEGETLDGWKIETKGHNSFSAFNWVFTPVLARPAERMFNPRYLIAKRRNASEDGYPRARFFVCNLLWHDEFNERPEPLELRALNYDIVIEAVDNYMDIAAGVRSTNGVEPTALVTITAQDSSPEPMESFKQVMDEFIYVLRLITGNLVNWYYGEAIDERTQMPVERIHQQAITRPYSNTVKFRPLRKGQMTVIPKMNLQELTEAFLNKSGAVLKRDDLKSLVNQFTNTCDQLGYLEMRGLLAATLTDLLALQFARQQGKSEAIPEKEYQAVYLPLLKESIQQSSWPGHVKRHLRGFLRGGHRATFHQRLGGLSKALNVGLSESDIGRMVRSRNSLVHEGTYASTPENGGWVEDYHLLTWTNLYVLCRLAGYQGDLPTFEAGQNIVV